MSCPTPSLLRPRSRSHFGLKHLDDNFVPYFLCRLYHPHAWLDLYITTHLYSLKQDDVSCSIPSLLRPRSKSYFGLKHLNDNFVSWLYRPHAWLEIDVTTHNNSLKQDEILCAIPSLLCPRSRSYFWLKYLNLCFSHPVGDLCIACNTPLTCFISSLRFILPNAVSDSRIKNNL